VSVQNVASLMHPSVTASSQLDTVRKAVDEMLNDVHVPLGEKDGNLVFLSEKLRDIEQERGAIALRTVDVKRIFNDALRESFDPLPRVSLHGTMAVATGLKGSGQRHHQPGGRSEHHPDHRRTGGRQRLRHRQEPHAGRLPQPRRPQRHRLAWPGRTPSWTTSRTKSIAASASPSCTATSPTKRSRTTAPASLTALPSSPPSSKARSSRPCRRDRLSFRGQATAVSALDADLLEAAKKLLADVADQVFDRYVEAPVRAAPDTAEKFLKVANPAAIGSSLDPLGLVQTVLVAPRSKPTTRR
jgi:hypothetical protein